MLYHVGSFLTTFILISLMKRKATKRLFMNLRRVTGCREGGELVEQFRMCLLAAHSGHRADIQRQVPDQPACGQLTQLEDVLHVVDVVDHQVVLVHTGDKACRGIRKGSDRKYTRYHNKSASCH